MALSGAAMIALEWGIFVPLAVIFVTIRYTVRYLYPSKFASTGNWLVGISFTLFIVVPALDTVGWRNGFYNDKEALETPISGDTTAFGMKIIYFNWLIFYFTLWITKGAILSVYHQIVPKDSRTYWITLHGLGLLMVIALVTALLLNLIWCRPIRLNWSLDKEELCFAPFDLTIVVSTGLMQVAVDIAIIIMPFPLLLAVNASTAEKTSIAAIFAMGILSVVATVSRLTLLFATESVELYTLLARTELTVGIIVACSPALRVIATQSSGATNNTVITMTPPPLHGPFAPGALGGGGGGGVVEHAPPPPPFHNFIVSDTSDSGTGYHRGRTRSERRTTISSASGGSSIWMFV